MTETEDTNFLLDCYRGVFARISYEPDSEKWIGRILDTEELLVFDGNTVEDALATFHAGVEECLKMSNGIFPTKSHTQTFSMIRYGIEERPFMEATREFLRKEGEL